MAGLFARDIERLENTGFASALGGPLDGAGPTEAVVCIESIACDLSNACTTPYFQSIANCTAISMPSCIQTYACDQEAFA